MYGSDAITGVVNFFLVHKFRGLEIGGSYGNTNLGASNDMGEWEAWIKAGTGDDKTEIVVIADFWERTGGLFSADRDLSSNAFQIPWGGFDVRSSNFPGRVADFGSACVPSMFFGPGGLSPQSGVNTPLPHSAPNAATSPFYKITFLSLRLRHSTGHAGLYQSQCVSRRSRYHRPECNPVLSTVRH